MINHLHLIIFSKDTIGFIRDFKKFVAREILKNIRQTEPNMLKIFRVQVRDTEPTVRDTELTYEKYKNGLFIKIGDNYDSTIKNSIWYDENGEEIKIN